MYPVYHFCSRTSNGPSQAPSYTFDKWRLLDKWLMKGPRFAELLFSKGWKFFHQWRIINIISKSVYDDHSFLIFNVKIQNSNKRSCRELLRCNKKARWLDRLGWGWDDYYSLRLLFYSWKGSVSTRSWCKNHFRSCIKIFNTWFS